MRARPLALALPVIAAAALAGCSTSIDAGKAEKQIKENLTGQGARIKSVTCPGGKTAKKGDTFRCDVVATDGTKGKVLLTETDDKGHVDLTSPFVNARKVEAYALGIVAKATGIEDAKLSCPEIVPIKAGGVETCTVTGADGTKGTATVTQGKSGADPTVNSDLLSPVKIERLFEDAISTQIGVSGAKVDCPDVIVPKTGGTETCKVTGADGTTGEGIVTEKDTAGNVAIDAPFVHIGRAEQLLTRSIARQTRIKGLKVDCPDIVAGRTGGQFMCTATGGGKTAKVRVTEKDTNGNITFKLLG